MKVRNYEKKMSIYFLLLVLIIIEIIILVTINITKIYIYESINGIVIKDDLVVLIVNNKTKNNIYKNTSLYLNNKRLKYEVVEDRGYVLKREKEKYSELLIRFKFNRKYKVNDSLQLVFKNKKIKIIEIFKIIWEGDINKNNS